MKEKQEIDVQVERKLENVLNEKESDGKVEETKERVVKEESENIITSE